MSFSDLVWGGYKFLTDCVMHVPFHFVRQLYLMPMLKKLGHHTEICRNVDIRSPRRISIGSHTTINKNVVLDGRGGQLVIGDNVDIAQDSRIWTLQHDYNSPQYEAIGADTIIEDYAWIASGVTILPGIKIGKGAVVGTCSVVTKDVAPYTIVAGIPAKKIGVRNTNLSYRLGDKRWFY